MKVTSPFKTHFGPAAAAIPSPLPFSHYTLPYTNPFGYSTFSFLLYFSKLMTLLRLIILCFVSLNFLRFSSYSMDYNYPTVCLLCLSNNYESLSLLYFYLL